VVSTLTQGQGTTARRPRHHGALKVATSGGRSSKTTVSYLFIAIVWANHHHLMHYAAETNFAHLFSVSLLPLSTAWMATSELAPQPVSFYAAVFFLVNATYI
jgi:hypothetical protein